MKNTISKLSKSDRQTNEHQQIQSNIVYEVWTKTYGYLIEANHCMRIPETIRYTRESESTFIASKSPYIKLEHDECLTKFIRNFSCKGDS